MSLTIDQMASRFLARYDRNGDGKVRTERGFWDYVLFRSPEVGGPDGAFAKRVDHQFLTHHYVDRLDLSQWIRRNVDLNGDGEIGDWEKALLFVRDRQAYQALS